MDSAFDLVAKGCTIPTTLAVGASFNCDYSDVATPGTKTNIATGDSDQTGPIADTATVVATPAEGPGLIINKTNNAPISTIGLPTVAAGATVTYTLAYTVSGGPVANATIVDILPDGVTYVVWLGDEQRNVRLPGLQLGRSKPALDGAECRRERLGDVSGDR